MTSPQRTTPTPSAPWRSFKEPPARSSGSFGGTLGVIAIAFGVGVLGAYMLDLHGHTCDRCGRRWRHFGAFNLGDEQSHTCPCCGQVQWWKCGAPHVLRGSQFVTPSTSPALASAPMLTPMLAPVPALEPPYPNGLPRATTAPSTAVAIRSREPRR